MARALVLGDVQAGRCPQDPLTSLACWALTGSAYCNSAWNWLFLVKVMIFRTVPNLEKIYQKRNSQPLSRAWMKDGAHGSHLTWCRTSRVTG